MRLPIKYTFKQFFFNRYYYGQIQQIVFLFCAENGLFYFMQI